MSWGATVLLVLFGAFVLLIIVNPNISCFGKRLRSPFTPLLRKRSAPKKTTDYHFHLVDGTEKKAEPRDPAKPAPKTEDYGFRRD